MSHNFRNGIAKFLIIGNKVAEFLIQSAKIRKKIILMKIHENAIPGRGCRTLQIAGCAVD